MCSCISLYFLYCLYLLIFVNISSICAVGLAPPSHSPKNDRNHSVFNDLGGWGHPHHLPPPENCVNHYVFNDLGGGPGAPITSQLNYGNHAIFTDLDGGAGTPPPLTSKKSMEIMLSSMMGVSSSPKLLLGGRGAEGSRITKMHRTVFIFMVWEVGGKGAAGVKIIRNAWAVIIFMVLELGGRGAAVSQIIRNAKDFIFMVLGGAGGGDWLRNHKKCIGCYHFHGFGSGLEGKAAGFRMRRNS